MLIGLYKDSMADMLGRTHANLEGMPCFEAIPKSEMLYDRRPCALPTQALQAHSAKTVVQK